MWMTTEQKKTHLGEKTSLSIFKWTSKHGTTWNQFLGKFRKYSGGVHLLLELNPT